MLLVAAAGCSGADRTLPPDLIGEGPAADGGPAFAADVTPAADAALRDGSPTTQAVVASSDADVAPRLPTTVPTELDAALSAPASM